MLSQIENIAGQLRDLNKKMEDQYTILEALCSEYLSIYKVNFDDGTFEIYKVTERLGGRIADIAGSSDQYDEVMQRYIDTYVMDENREYLRNAVRKEVVLSKLKTNQNYVVRYKVMGNGQEYEYFDVQYVDASKTPEEHMVIMAYRNVDSVVHREEEIRTEIEQGIQDTLTGSGIGMWAIEYEDGCAPRMTCNGKMRNLLGIEAAELTPEECYNWWYDRIAEGSLKAVQEYADRILKDGYAEITYTWEHPAWGDIYVRCGGIVDKKYEKKGTRTRGYHQDVTEITLERMTQQKKLVEALHATKRANRAKTEFLSHMSHDIRTPINGIIGLLNVADKNPDSGEIQRMTREKIGELAEHLLSLVNDVLQISAIESSEIELQEESFRLTELIENSIRLLMAQAVKKNVTIRTEYEELPYQELAGSAPHIRQILLHVIGNAIKFNRDGGSVTVRVSQEKQEDGQVMCSLEIEDTGIGMSSDYVGRVCEPFTQERSDARTNYEGTGLGMAIAKGIIEHMHGTIRIESEQGKGTTVYVQLPLKIAETKKTEEKAPKQHGNVANMKVLLVEDNEINREITQFVLEDAGVSVVNAADGQQAVRLFEASAENEFDCVLMDILMPVMDGLAATRTIRRLQRADAGTIPIIALSANAFSEDARRAIEAGMNEHMCKPVHAQTLIAMLARYRNQSEKS